MSGKKGNEKNISITEGSKVIYLFRICVLLSLSLDQLGKATMMCLPMAFKTWTWSIIDVVNID